MMKPAHVRAKAPVARFAVLLSFGSELECSPPRTATSFLPAATRLACLRSAFRPEKYIADPHPVRNVLGNVPRQNCRMGFGPLAMERMVPRSVLERDCCTRVLRRSAGWRRTAERTPELRPAKKWTATVSYAMRRSSTTLLTGRRRSRFAAIGHCASSNI